MKNLFLITLAAALLIGCMPLGFSICDNSKCGELAGNWTYSWNDISGVQHRMVLEILPKFVQNSRETCAFDFNGKIKTSSWERSLSGRCYDDESFTGSPLRAEGDEYTPGESAKKNFRITKIDLNRGTLLYQNGSGYWEFSRVDQIKQPSADITIEVPDITPPHPLAIKITLREKGKPIPNAKLNVHAFNLPDNYEKLAVYFLTSSCTNCFWGSKGDKKFASICKGYKPISPNSGGLLGPTTDPDNRGFTGFEPYCPLREKPLEVLTDKNGIAKLEFFLDLAKLGDNGPRRWSPISIPVRVEYWGENGDKKVAESEIVLKTDYVAVVEDITYEAPPKLDIVGEPIPGWKETGKLASYTDPNLKPRSDPGTSTGRIQADRVRVTVEKPERLSEGSQVGRTLNVNDTLYVGDYIIINAEKMRVTVAGSPPVTYTGGIWVKVRFLDGTVGMVGVSGLVPSHFVAIGKDPKKTGFKDWATKFIEFAMDVNDITDTVPIPDPKSEGTKFLIKTLTPGYLPGYELYQLGGKAVKVVSLVLIEKPVYIIIESAILVDYDDQGQMIVTTREGNATIFTEATGEDGFAVPAGKTAVIPFDMKPILSDTDSTAAQEADDLLSNLGDPFAMSPVFSEPGSAAQGSSSSTNGTASEPGETGIPGAGNATAGNATSGTSASGVPSVSGPGTTIEGNATPGTGIPGGPGGSGSGASAGGTSTPANNNQIGDAAQVSSGQSLSQTISPAGSSNFYGFKADNSGIVKLKLENVPEDMRPYLGLSDKNMAIISEKLASNPGDTLTLEKDVQGPGWFYIEVKDVQGNAYTEPYTLKVAFEPAPDQYEPNPNYFRATEVKPGDTINAYTCPVNDEDIYRIHVDTDGILKLKLEEVPEGMRSELYVYDENLGGLSVALGSASNPGDKVSIEQGVSGPGWYYIKMRDLNSNAYSEPYTLKVDFEPAPDQYEPNPNYFRATEIAPGQSVTAYICPPGDEDIYKFNAGSSGRVKVNLEDIPKDMRAMLQIYDKTFGNEIAYSQASSPGDDVRLEKDIKGPGWFYVKVKDADGKAHSQPYTLTASF